MSGPCTRWLWKVPGFRARVRSIHCMRRLGGLAWEHVGAWEKGSPRQDCVQGPPPCLEKRASELRSSGGVHPHRALDSGNLGLRKWKLWAPTQSAPSLPELEAQAGQGVGQHDWVGDLVPTKTRTGERARSVWLPSYFLLCSFIHSAAIVFLSTSPMLGTRGIRGQTHAQEVQSQGGETDRGGVG